MINLVEKLSYLHNHDFNCSPLPNRSAKCFIILASDISTIREIAFRHHLCHISSDKAVGQLHLAALESFKQNINCLINYDISIFRIRKGKYLNFTQLNFQKTEIKLIVAYS